MTTPAGLEDVDRGLAGLTIMSTAWPLSETQSPRARHTLTMQHDGPAKNLAARVGPGEADRGPAIPDRAGLDEVDLGLDVADRAGLEANRGLA
eukprot:8772750-Alexandrium_andersonii.AAC.1